MTYARKVDANQADITAQLRRVGASVQPIHTLGKGVPDLLVGYRGQNFILEVKDGAKSASRQKLTPDEAQWHAMWRGQVLIVCSTSEALAAIGATQ
jgi:hypothetical protein